MDVHVMDLQLLTKNQQVKQGGCSQALDDPLLRYTSAACQPQPRDQSPPVKLTLTAEISTRQLPQVSIKE
ncbi:unnamed protein product [Toxocara canis]|uniref:Uncharacterized protein n=1 Tax=Toxocara canis TaxID=6265 RepID=A0A183TW24_TOXCA|nr:unnamed protein product [Toxocara canis]